VTDHAGITDNQSLISIRSRTMTAIHLTQTTIATPEQFIDGLTDFGPGREKLFPNSTDEYLEVHDRARTTPM
jgi:hypothetical protein